MRARKLLALAVVVGSPLVYAFWAVVPQIAFVLFAVAAGLAVGFLGNPAFVQVFMLILIGAIFGAFGEFQAGNVIIA